jgi:hypothetical protein
MSQREVNFYHQVTQQRPGSDMRSLAEVSRVAIYIDRAAGLARSFEIEDFPTVAEIKTLPTIQNAEAILMPSYYAIELFMNKIYSRNVFAIDGQFRADYVVLDDHWRTRATSHLSHVRAAVEKAELPERLRQSIFNKLNELQAELDRNQTRVRAAVETMAELCEGVGAGAKSLEPAVKILERIVGAFHGLQRKVADNSAAPQLPAPDTLGLPDYSEKD